MENAIGFIFRYFHVLAGITWIGMLYYFNFVQTEYFKEAEADAKKDAMAKLAPRALWWFRWGARFFRSVRYRKGIHVPSWLRQHIL